MEADNIRSAITRTTTEITYRTAPGRRLVDE